MKAVSYDDDRVVVFVDFCSVPTPPGTEQEDPWRPVTATGSAAPGRQACPVRWSARPVRTFAHRFAGSRLAADLRDYAWLIGLLLAVLLVLLAAEQMSALIHPHTGGTR